MVMKSVLHSVRDISVKGRVDTDSVQIRVVSTFQADENIVNCVKNSEENFKQTPSFRSIWKIVFFCKEGWP